MLSRSGLVAEALDEVEFIHEGKPQRRGDTEQIERGRQKAVSSKRKSIISVTATITAPLLKTVDRLALGFLLSLLPIADCFLFSPCPCVSVASFQRLRRSDSRPASIVSIGVEKEKRT